MAFWDDWFGGGNDPYEAAQPYLNQIEPMMHQYYDPYSQFGGRAMPTLEQQYAQMMQNPGAMYANMGQGYQQSPGYQFNMDQAMQGSNAAMASAGMLGTPAHQQQNMGYASQLANQDYGNYMNQMMNLYKQGVGGTEQQLGYGYKANDAMAGGLGNLYGSQANLAFGKQASNNQGAADMWGTLLGLGGAAAGSLLGPAGTAMGGMIGNKVGGIMGGSDKGQSGWMG